MQSERAREAAEYRAKDSETARTITATADRDVVVLRGNAQRQADQTRDEGDAERNRILPRPMEGPGFLAFYRSMQAYETGLNGSDTRMVMSPKSDFFRFFWHTQWSAGNARRGCAVCSPLAHDPHKSDHARCAAQLWDQS
jgi:modulator of FtsH protease HflC